MKKVLLAIAVIALIGCASCSKTKVCKCSYKIGPLSYELPAKEYEVKSCSDINDIGIAGIADLVCTSAK